MPGVPKNIVINTPNGLIVPCDGWSETISKYVALEGESIIGNFYAKRFVRIVFDLMMSGF